MTDFEVYSADFESRFEGHRAQSQDCEQTRHLARVLLEHLPPWLEDEIRADRLSILDWGCAEGEGVNAWRTHFPQNRAAGIDPSPNAIRQARAKFGPQFFTPEVLRTPPPVIFDVLTTSHVLHYCEAPWKVLRELGAHVARHLLILVPFRVENLPGSRYTFDDASISTRIDPDFLLSSCHVISAESASQILLVYSRPSFVPRAGAVFTESAHSASEANPQPPTPDPQPRERTGPDPGPLAPDPGPRERSEPDPIETIILPQLRCAQAVAVVACAIPFSSALNQRPICCARYLADQGVTVLFVELWQWPEQPIHRTGEEVYPRIFSIPFYAFQSDIRFTFQDHLDAIASAAPARKSYLCTIPTRELVAAARVLRAAGFHIHYDIMDDWEAFFEGDEDMNHWFSAPVELEMVALADTVTAVSRKLVEKFRRLRSDIAEMRNGYQPSALACEQFASVHAGGETPGPRVVGYFGHFADAWFDWETLFYAARQRPAIEFELIGYGLSDHSLLRLNAFPNIRFVGLVPQKDLRQYAQKWWAAMIPFRSSTLSAAVDPLKVYEYLHFGLPVVVTGIPGVAGYPMVHLVSDAESFVAALDRLPARPSEQSLSEVAGFLKHCLWEARLEGLEDMLGRAAGEVELAVREDALRSDARYWQAKAAELENRLKRQQREVSAGAQEWQSTAEKLEKQLAGHARTEVDLLARIERLQQEQAAREAEVASQEAALRSHAEYWQAKSADLDKQLLEQSRQHQQTASQFRAIEENLTAEIRTLSSRAAASAYEAANLRRLSTDLLRSRSWRITAPLRFLSKPLFSAPAASHPTTTSGPAESPKSVGMSAGATRSPLDALWAELRRARSIAVVPCAVPFRSTFGQRPISCAKYLAGRGCTVVYVSWQQSPGDDIPADGQEVYPHIFHLSLSAFQSNLDCMASVASPQPPTPNPQPLFLSTLPNPELVEAARTLRAGNWHIHYDIMDDWEEFHRAGEAPWYAAPLEQELVTISDTVSAVSSRLTAKFAGLRSGIVEVRNGYDPAALGCRQFAAARAPLERPKTVGYFGHLSDGWFDWEAVLEAARKLSDVEFELIGYGLSDRSRARLAGLANVRFPGLVAQSDLHRYARKWWAGIIPFRSSDLSAAADPLKIYEYLHLGLPAVVTGVSGIADYPLVHYAADRTGFISAIERIEDRPPDPSLAEAAEFLKGCTWEARLAKLESLLTTAQSAGYAKRQQSE